MPKDLGVSPDDIISSGGEKKAPEQRYAKVGRAKRGADKKMDETDFQKLVFTLATDAQAYVRENLSDVRETSTLYYKGSLPDVDEKTDNEDRSRAVLSEVRDTVLGMMPDLLRIFFSADNLIQYMPVPAAEPELFNTRIQQAKQATEYVRNVVLATDNPDFFLDVHSAFQDALVRKSGFLKWWWEKSKKPLYSTHTGLDENMVLALTTGDDVEVIGKRSYIDDDTATGPALKYDVKIKRYSECGRARVQSVPCENVIVSRRGSAMERMPLFGYTEEKSVGDLLDMGLIDDISEVDDADNDPFLQDSTEAQARKPEQSSVISGADDTPEDKTRRLIQYAELYLFADFDGDEIPELRRVVTVGTAFKVLENEPWDDIQFASFCPYPEAHEFIGESVADLTMDIQRIKSRVLRDMLDSLAQSVKPQTAVVEGKVNLDDVLNPDTSNVIRMQAPGMVQALITPFVGKEAMPVLDFMTSTRENRTGMSEASQGLDPDILQSTNEKAVVQTISKAQGRIEMVARIFVETGWKRLFRGLLKLIVKHQEESRTVRLRGSVVAIDPKAWDATMDVEVNFPLGRGSSQEQIQFLTMIHQKQEQILGMLGPDNPFVTLDQYYFTIARIIELGGHPNVDNFFTDPSKMPPEKRQQIVQAMQQAQQAAAGGGAGPAAPDPATERAKIESNERIKTAEISQKSAQAAAELQFKQIELETEMRTKVMIAYIQHNSSMDQAQLDAMVTHAGDRLKANTQLVVEHLKVQAAKANKQEGSNGGTSND